jgi:hypothetical protein
MQIINSALEARDAYDSMTPADQAAVRDAVKKGADRIRAVNLARSQHAQDTARTAVSAEEDLRPRTLGEKASSFAQGAADTLSMGLAPLIKGGVQAAAFPMDKGAAFSQGYHEQKQRQAAADEQAPAAAGAGHLAGDVINSAFGLAAPAKSAMTAAEDLAAGAKIGDVVSVASPETKRGIAAVARKVDSFAKKIPEPLLQGANLLTGGYSHAGLGLARALKNLGVEAPAAIKGLSVPAEVMAGATPKAAAALNIPADVMAGETPLSKMASDVVTGTAPKGAVADAAEAQRAMDDMAESYDPGGRDWKNWLTGTPATPEPRPELDKAAKVLSTGTRVDRTPIPKGKTPTPSPEADLSSLPPDEPIPPDQPTPEDAAQMRAVVERDAPSKAQARATRKWIARGSPERAPQPNARERAAAPFTKPPAATSSSGHGPRTSAALAWINSLPEEQRAAAMAQLTFMNDLGVL